MTLSTKCRFGLVDYGYVWDIILKHHLADKRLTKFLQGENLEKRIKLSLEVVE